MRRRQLLAAGIAMVVAVATAQADELKELDFGVVSTDSSAVLKTKYEPFFADMAKAIGIPVRGFYATDYAAVIEAMRFNKVQAAHFGNASAIQAVDRSDGEIFVQAIGLDGTAGYYSLLIVHKDSPLQSLDQVVKSPGQYTFGNGDPNSTSGFLIPSYYAWARNGIDPRKHFARMVTANHESNLLSVANRQVDLATNNTESLERFQNVHPDKARLVREIWRSPLIPGDPFVWRKDLAPSVKQKVKAFVLAYGTAGADVARQKEIMKGLVWSGFRESTNAQLLPVRQVGLYRDKLKLEGDMTLSADDKAKRIADIDAKLATLAREMDAAGVKVN